MTQNFKIDLVSPAKILLSKDVYEVVIPGSEGDFGVLSGHSAFVSKLRPGVISVLASESEKDTEEYFVSGGYAEICENDCTILVEEATAVRDIKKDDIQKRLEQAEKQLSRAENDIEKIKAEKEIEISTAMLQFAS